MGFVPGVGIETCKADVLAQMAALMRNSSPTCDARRPHIVMFDFKAAYDSVNRELLYRRLVDRKILAPSQLALLRFLYDNLRVTVGRA
jgi:hypothetical protein